MDKTNFEPQSIVDDGKPRVRSTDSAIRAFFHDVSPDDAEWAAGRLVPQSRLPTQEVTPLTHWPDVPSSYILGTQDQSVRPEWSRRAAPERLGVPAFEIDTGHSPFLSQPKHLATVLDAIADL